MDIPALLRKGALEAPGGRLDFSQDMSILRKRVLSTPQRANQMGHYFLSAADFGEDPSTKVRGPMASASYFEWAFTDRHPNSSNAG